MYMQKLSHRYRIVGRCWSGIFLEGGMVIWIICLLDALIGDSHSCTHVLLLCFPWEGDKLRELG
jgi:hypothetical protein